MDDVGVLLKIGFTISGPGYYPSVDVIKTSIKVYKETGNNVFKEFNKLYLCNETYKIYDPWVYENDTNRPLLDLYKKYLDGLSIRSGNEYINKKAVVFEYNRRKAFLDYKESYDKRRKEASLYTYKHRESILNKKGRVCVACGSKKDLSIDHIIPVKRGGEDKMLNFQILCRSCNSKKGDK